MKSILDEESRKALVNYRMQRADESLEEALILCHTGHYNASMNRLYYAFYYAIVAALLQKDVNAAAHAGVKTMFNLHFISTGLLSKEHRKTFSRLFEIRHTSDYDDFVFCDQEMFEDSFPKEKMLIDAIKIMLAS